MNLRLVRKKKDIIFNNGNYESYRKKVEKFFEGNLDNLTVYKIRHNQRLNETEKKELEEMFQSLGNNAEYEKAYPEKSLIEVVRSIVGLDEETANEIFAKYINPTYSRTYTFFPSIIPSFFFIFAEESTQNTGRIPYKLNALPMLGAPS